MKRPILLHPDPRLKKAAAPVADLSDELRVLGDDMLTTMYDAPGIGLAAPQIGVLSRVIVLDCVKEEGEAPRPLLMFNPEIVASSDDLNTYEEGCLSIPGVYLDVVRPTAIELSYRDEMGRPKKMKADGLMARCIQHEMDHLNGVLFVDRVTDEAGLQKELNDHGFQRQHVQSVS